MDARGGNGAGNETRTRDPDLGKVVLYQLSYSRAAAGRLSDAPCERGHFNAWAGKRNTLTQRSPVSFVYQGLDVVVGER